MRTFKNICEDNYSLIFRYILGMIRDKEYAQDLTQEVFFIAYKKGKEFENHVKPEAFLYTTAKHVVLAHFRNSKKEIPNEFEEDIPSNEGDIFEQLCKVHEDKIEDKEYRKQVLKHLSDKDMILYEKYYIENKSMKEIAKIMNTNEVAIRMRYVRLRKKVKNIVSNLNLGEF